MGDSSGDETWGNYLRRMTSRPGWSVARLARESGIHRATIFGWIAEDRPRSIKLDSAYAIADALGEDRGKVLRVIGEVTAEHTSDPELDLIRASKLSAMQKNALIRHVLARRERELAEMEMIVRAQERER